MMNKEANCTGSCLTKEFTELCEKIKKESGTVLMCLQHAQAKYKYVSRENMEIIAKTFAKTTAEVFSVASFYSQFRFKPQGRFHISLCLGTACYVQGAGLILTKLEEVLKVKLGETTADGKFTLDSARCVGCCGLAPVMLINDKVYPAVAANKIEEILKEYEGK